MVDDFDRSIGSILRFNKHLWPSCEYFHASHELVGLRGHFKHKKKLCAPRSCPKPCVSHSLQSTQYSNSTRFFISLVITMDMKTISTKSCVANLVCQFEAFLGISFGIHLASMSIWRWLHWNCAISSVAIWMQATTTRALEHTRTLLDSLLLSTTNAFRTFSPKLRLHSTVYHIVYVVAASL